MDTHDLFRTEKKRGDSQGFQAVQPIKAVGSQALDPVVVQVPVDKPEMISGGASWSFPASVSCGPGTPC